MRLPGASREINWSLKCADERRRGWIALRTCAELRPGGFRNAKRPFKLIIEGQSLAVSSLLFILFIMVLQYLFYLQK